MILCHHNPGARRTNRGQLSMTSCRDGLGGRTFWRAGCAAWRGSKCNLSDNTETEAEAGTPLRKGFGIVLPKRLYQPKLGAEIARMKHIPSTAAPLPHRP